MTYGKKTLIECLNLIVEHPRTIDELSKELNIKRKEMVLNIVRNLKINSNVKMIKIGCKRYVFINDTKNCMLVYNMIRKKYNDKFLAQGEICFKDLRTMINKRYIK